MMGRDAIVRTAAGLIVLALGLVARPAFAWRQYHTKDTAVACSQSPESCGCGLRWYQNDIGYLVDDTGLTGVSDAAIRGAVEAGFAAWEQVQCTLCGSSDGPGCPPDTCASHPLGLHLHDDGFAPPTAIGATCKKMDAKGETCVDVASNGNFVMFVKDKAQWQKATNQSQFVFALTILTYNRQTGAIADADILLDDADFDFCSSDCGPNDNSLCNTLTHEAGHFLGLDHSTDPDATMYATAPAGETRKCSLHDDDRLGLCTAYRTACSAQGCPENQKGGGFLGLCSAAPAGRPGASLGLALLALAVLGIRRKRAR